MVEKKSNFIICYILLIVSTCIVMSPVVYMFSIAFKPTTAFTELKISKLTLENFIDVVSDVQIMSTYRNSFIIASFTVLVTLILASLGGYGLSRFKVKIQSGLIMIFLVTQMLPVELLALGYFPIVTRLSLYDTRSLLVLLHSTLTVPFCALLMKSMFDGIPTEIEDAAMIDGCSRIGCFIKVILPLSRGGLFAVATFSFLESWKEFLYALTFTSSYHAMPVTVEISRLLGHYGISWGKMMALAIFTTIPIFVIFVLFQKSLMKGLTLGAVKMQ